MRRWISAITIAFGIECGAAALPVLADPKIPFWSWPNWLAYGVMALGVAAVTYGIDIWLERSS